jgi:hypothetical protein
MTAASMSLHAERHGSVSVSPLVHAGCVEPIFEAVLANDPSRITTAAAAQRMEEDLFVAELPHWLYRGDTPAGHL